MTSALLTVILSKDILNWIYGRKCALKLSLLCDSAFGKRVDAMGQLADNRSEQLIKSQ